MVLYYAALIEDGYRHATPCGRSTLATTNIGIIAKIAVTSHEAGWMKMRAVSVSIDTSTVAIVTIESTSEMIGMHTVTDTDELSLGL